MFLGINYLTKYGLLSLVLLWLLSCSNQKQLRDSTNKIDTFYQTFGKGKPILIINGGPGMNSDGYTFMAKEIAKLNYKTIIYDQRGTGRSIVEHPDTTNITLDLMVEDIENLRRKLKIKKWYIFGQSFGGMLATHYVAKYPKRVKKVIFSSSAGVNLNIKQYLQSNIYDKLTKSQQDSLDSLYQDETEKRLEIISNAYVYNKQYATQIAERLKGYNAQINRLVYHNLYKIEYDYTGGFTESKIPVLVLQGKEDIISVETAQEIADSFGNSQIILLENCAHFGWLDSKDKYLDEIKLFLED